MAIIPGLENINWFGFMGEAMRWLGIILTSMITIGIIAAGYYVWGFQIKATEFRLYGSGKQGNYSVPKPKGNRYKWIKNRSAWKPLYPLGNKIELEPFDTEFIYPGNRVWSIIVDDKTIPCRINVEKTKEQVTAEIKPVPISIRNWQSLTHKKHAIEFAKHNFWEDNKQVLMTLATVVFCLVVCGLTVYFTYKFNAPGIAASDRLADAIKGIGNIPGK